MKSADIEKKIDEVKQNKEAVLEALNPLQEQFKEELAKEALGDKNSVGELRAKISTLNQQLEEADQLLPALREKLKKQQLIEQKETREKARKEADKVKKDIKENHLPEVEKSMGELQEKLETLIEMQRVYISLMNKAKGSSHAVAPNLGYQMEKELVKLLQRYELGKNKQDSRTEKRSQKFDKNEPDKESYFSSLQDMTEEELVALQRENNTEN